MARKDFVPGEDKVFRDNFGVFVEEVTDPDAPYAARYGITPAKQTQATALDADLIAKHDRVVSLQTDLIVAQSNYDSSKANSTNFWRAEARDIKSNAQYTDIDGRVLRIEGKEVSTDLQGQAPVLKALATPQGVEISYVKGASEGIELYSQRAQETAMTPLKRITKSRWVDARPNLNSNAEELRQYAALFVQNDDEVGNRSATISAVSPARL